ncbi:kinase-like domain-containing protein [Leptodontidium sp. MPI-SDFR-AT-0119]|nr:kinase-like domain-containing protein [Leptodontidium sp. MPI-SDFR-AT-0119]
MDQTTNATNGAPTMYSFSMQEMVTLEDSISYTFMSRDKRFIIEIAAERLGGEGSLVDEFYEFKDDIDDPDILCDFETWAIGPIHERVKQLVPLPISSPTTLLEYYDPETYVFELFNEGGILKANELAFDPKIFGDASPKVAIIENAESRLSSSREVPRDVIVSRSALPTVPLVPASQLVRAAGLDSVEEMMCEILRIVRKVNTTDEFFFKSGDKRHGFQREVEILAKLQKISEHDVSIRTSRIVGLVNWDGQESLLMGMLLERIDGMTLHDAMLDASVAERRRWMDQIDETVERLHKYGIVWGDVKPDNVMIGPSGDAILIDFGGGCTLEYVEMELQETKEGDLQGLKKLRSRLLSR